MRTLYIECNMGAAGDMLMAALYELLPEPGRFIDKLNSLGLKDVTVRAVTAEKCGIHGHRMEVSVDGVEEESVDVHEHHDHKHEHHHKHDHHDHTGLGDITSLIRSLDIPDAVKDKACSVYKLIAEAEANAHGKPLEHVHFHEVGTLDAVCDIVGCCLALNMLAPDRVIVSPIHVGSGNVRCQHGILPVPAPATAYILRGVPMYSGDVKGELCTPTGAALLKAFADSFGPMPVMCVNATGYGMGKKDFERANCVRVFLGESGGSKDDIVELCCNLDDMTPEAIGFAFERLIDAGALDVYTTPIGMKKNRPGVLLSCMCRPEQREKMVQLIFKHTTTIGIREYTCNRYTLTRTEHITETQYGPVRVKKATGYGVSKEKLEYEDIARIARENGESILTTKP